MDDQMTEVEEALFLMISVFQSYCTGQRSLTECQFRRLVMEQMPHIYQGFKSNEDFMNMFCSLDWNRNDKICFPEYAMMMAGLAFAQKACETQQSSS